MYQIDKTFDEVRKNNEGLFRKLVQKLKRQDKYKRCYEEELYSLVLTSAWQAWLVQQKQAVNGLAKYTLGTYLTLSIKKMAKQYKDLVIDSVSLDDKIAKSIPDVSPSQQEEDKEWIEENMLYLPDREFEVLYQRFYQNQTLAATGNITGRSKESIRQTELGALDNLKTKLED